MLAVPPPRRPSTIEELIGPALMARLDRVDLASRRIFAGKLPGERRSKRRGQSVEFDDYRQYSPGDDIRRIDWKVYARLDRVFLKLFLEEQDLALHMAIDCSLSMDAGTPNKLIFCQRLAMALGYIGLVKQNRVTVTAFGGERLERLEEIRGKSAATRLGAFLLNKVKPGTAGTPGRGADFTSAMRAISLTRRTSGVMVVMSDFLLREGYEDGLKLLSSGGGGNGGAAGGGASAAAGLDVFCAQVLSPGEVDPQLERMGSFSLFEGAEKAGAGGRKRARAGDGLLGDLRLTDVETGHAAEVTVTAGLIKRYKENLEKHCAGLSAFCAARRMTHLMLRSDADLDGLLLQDLRKRGMLR